MSSKFKLKRLKTIIINIFNSGITFNGDFSTIGCDIIFDGKERLLIKKARESFLTLGIEDNVNIRNEILESWKRSKQLCINPYSIEKKVLHKKALEKRISDRKLLYNKAIPIIETLYKLIKGSNFMISLSDEDGYLLKVIGDENILSIAAKTNLIEGCNRSEKSIGTNGIGTCLALKKPVQVWEEEHWYHLDWNLTCSSAPILNRDGKVLGALCLTGTWDKVHMHTFGMVVANAEVISKQIILKHVYDELYKVKGQVDISIESLKTGVILINKNCVIIKVNTLASSIFKISKSNLENNKISNFIKEIDFLKMTENIYNREVTVETNNSIKISLTAVIIDEYDESSLSGILITFEEIKHIYKKVSRISGSNAHFHFDDIIGKSVCIIDAKKAGKLASQNNSNVLIVGESGTGKELFAQSIHNDSIYSNGPFIDINCGALPKNLIESELFGYESGTFTGAKREGCVGKFELANGGTIFLDEIGDMPLDLQVCLLRVIQNREVFRIGGKKPIKIDVRIIAATNCDLEKLILNKTFRKDLFYRLNVFNIKIPSLRERSHDICLLADYFLEKYTVNFHKRIKRIDNNVYNIFLNYNWPGNVRELENTIERAVLVAKTDTITISELPINIISNDSNFEKNLNVFRDISTTSSNVTFREVERNLILDTIKTYNGNVKKAAESLGISRRTLYRWLNKYRIDYKMMR